MKKMSENTYARGVATLKPHRSASEVSKPRIFTSSVSKTSIFASAEPLNTHMCGRGKPSTSKETPQYMKKMSENTYASSVATLKPRCFASAVSKTHLFASAVCKTRISRASNYTYLWMWKATNQRIDAREHEEDVRERVCQQRRDPEAQPCRSTSSFSASLLSSLKLSDTNV